MSEPHIGYGKYISYILWGVLGTFILIRIIMFANLAIRRSSTVLFFNTETEIVESDLLMHVQHTVFLLWLHLLCVLPSVF